ncbi:MAG: hypothetical protein JU82_08695 [Sulfuricurvum sp. MLSB]|uniref:hypothetical protein n=1 Tax=unclassified Sulfuricurvum TaxID=2632390 RepID=UPI000508CE27|nr:MULTISPECIES: hypothetical protein [unclassified Sulfuricurvum]KFN39050.1 MAG: hypothetical protein JU82_08695 [Sulfuricurvum sp. MLSB]
MKSWILIVFFAVSPLLQADASQKLYDLYQRELYSQGCDYGYQVFTQNKRNEAFVSLLGFSCLKADHIDRLSPVISALHATPDARANSAYFSLLLMQKKLLAQALYDNKPIVNLKFPTSAHLLSKVFELYLKNPKSSDIVKEYTDPLNPRQSYKLYTTDSWGRKSIAIDEYYDKILTIHHVY